MHPELQTKRSKKKKKRCFEECSCCTLHTIKVDGDWGCQAIKRHNKTKVVRESSGFLKSNLSNDCKGLL